MRWQGEVVVLRRVRSPRWPLGRRRLLGLRVIKEAPVLVRRRLGRLHRHSHLLLRGAATLRGLGRRSPVLP